MAFQVKWSPRAISNLEDICNYIARDSDFYASLFAKRVIDIVQNISQFPRSGRVVPEYRNENLRKRFIKITE